MQHSRDQISEQELNDSYSKLFINVRVSVSLGTLEFFSICIYKPLTL